MIPGSISVDYRVVWLHIAEQRLGCALARGYGVVFRHTYQSMAKHEGKELA
jgi:hypothetical protein